MTTMKTKMMLIALPLAAIACMAPESEPYDIEDEPVAEVSSALTQRDLTVVAWAEQGEVVTKAYCLEFEMVAGTNNKCTCDGFEGQGIFNSNAPNKCTLCKAAAGGWPCSVELTDTSDSMSVSFYEGGNGHIAYLRLNSLDQPVIMDGPQTFACDAQESLDFAVVRSHSSNILAKGEVNLSLTGCP